MTGILPGAVGATVAIIVGNVDGVMESIVLAAAAVGALGVIRQKVCKPVMAFAGRVDATLEDLRGLPLLDERMEKVEAQLIEVVAGQAHYEGRLTGIEHSLGSMATSERLAVRQALRAD